ncbi:MAG TPA: ABC transporter permease subunit, partial [Trueperaceae bacterium]|nr:ABC transporter permease subunit [Trueperaceae bacterium]
LLSMIESLADFGNPIVLGGNRRYLATEVYLSLTGRFNPTEAAVYGVVLLALVLLAFFVQRWWLGGGSFITVTGKPSSGALVRLPPRLEIVLTSILLLWTVFVAALYFSIVLGSFTQLWGVDYSLTIEHYQDFMTAGWPVFLYTLRIAAISALPAMLLGFLVAYLVSRQRFWGRRFIEFGSLLSFATPGTVMGVAYIFAFNTGPWLLTSTATIIILALVFRNMPVTIRSAVAGIAQIDPSLEEASTMLRARSFTTMRRILFPLLVNTLVTGLIFAFVRAVTAVSQVIFLVSPGNLLATVLLLGWVEQGQLGRAAAMGTILIVSMLLTIMVVLALARRIGTRAMEVTAT